MSVNSRLIATNIIGQRKAFYRLRTPESSSARKETVDLDILGTYLSGWSTILLFTSSSKSLLTSERRLTGVVLFSCSTFPNIVKYRVHHWNAWHKDLLSATPSAVIQYVSLNKSSDNGFIK